MFTHNTLRGELKKNNHHTCLIGLGRGQDKGLKTTFTHLSQFWGRVLLLLTLAFSDCLNGGSITVQLVAYSESSRR